MSISPEIIKISILDKLITTWTLYIIMYKTINKQIHVRYACDFKGEDSSSKYSFHDMNFKISCRLKTAIQQEYHLISLSSLF